MRYFITGATGFIGAHAVRALLASGDDVTAFVRAESDRRRLAEQERVYRWLHGWLVLHVPLSAALLVLGVTHAVMALYY